MSAPLPSPPSIPPSINSVNRPSVICFVQQAASIKCRPSYYLPLLVYHAATFAHLLHDQLGQPLYLLFCISLGRSLVTAPPTQLVLRGGLSRRSSSHTCLLSDVYLLPTSLTVRIHHVAQLETVYHIKSRAQLQHHPPSNSLFSPP